MSLPPLDPRTWPPTSGPLWAKSRALLRGKPASSPLLSCRANEELMANHLSPSPPQQLPQDQGSARPGTAVSLPEPGCAPPLPRLEPHLVCVPQPSTP